MHAGDTPLACIPPFPNSPLGVVKCLRLDLLPASVEDISVFPVIFQFLHTDNEK